MSTDVLRLILWSKANRPVHTGLVFSTITRDQPATMPEQASDGASKADATAELTKDKDTQIETLDAIQERPDMDLFKAIFQDSDSDTTEVSSDEEETINTSEKVSSNGLARIFFLEFSGL